MLDIQGLQIAFGNSPVLRGLDLSVSAGEIMCLLGPSGCGKTTALRVVAGLETPQAGDVRFEGQSILTVPVHERGFGLMFQDFALFPHLDVATNIEFGLKMLGVPPARRTERVREVLELVGLKGFERRDVASMSGGERQRVALARSLAPNPRLLMLDEPLGSLDAALRERLVVELREIIKRVSLTAVYVTHDQGEAFAIADRVAVMNVGRIEQVDKPEMIYRRPMSVFVAQFLRLENIFPITSRHEHMAHTAVGDFPFEGQARAILLHPDGIQIVAPNTPGAISGLVQERVFQGDIYQVKLQTVNQQTLAFKVSSAASRVPQVGEKVAVQTTPELVIPLWDANPDQSREQASEFLNASLKNETNV